MPRLKVITFGCQANELDSARIAGLLAVEGYTLTEDEAEADLIILNGCSIREKAEQKLYSRLGAFRALKARRTSLKVGIAGCLGQREGASLFRRFPHLDLVVGNGEHLAEIPRLLAADEPTSPHGADEPAGFFPESVSILRESSTHAWVGIMEGCDQFCSFCIVPFTRGRERSRHPDDILREVRDLAGRGYREITLLGQTVNSYGGKLAPSVSFAELLRRIDAEVKAGVRIRFTTSHPKDVTAELARALADLPSLCPHVHLPVQSGATRTLARMARGYDRDAYLEKIRLLRDAVPNLAITTDIIAGFPGESEEDFAATLSLMREVRFDGCFAFKFSARPGTPAAILEESVPEPVKAARLAQILELQDAISLERNRALVGARVEVLLDPSLRKRESALAAGRTRHNKIVHFSGWSEPAGVVVPVEITQATAHHLKGVLIASL
jgi:tRNA-2-methylthio-N6-dimethylallyladenosine synthase